MASGPETFAGSRGKRKVEQEAPAREGGGQIQLKVGETKKKEEKNSAKEPQTPTLN